MRTLRSGPDFLGSARVSWGRERSGAFQVDGLAANHGCRQVRRMLQRGQSRQSTGAEAHGVLAGSEGEESEEKGVSGHTTALTRRGLSVVVLSWHWLRNGQERQ